MYCKHFTGAGRKRTPCRHMDLVACCDGYPVDICGQENVLVTTLQLHPRTLTLLLLCSRGKLWYRCRHVLCAESFGATSVRIACSFRSSFRSVTSGAQVHY